MVQNIIVRSSRPAMKLVFSLSVPREEKVFLIDMLFNQLEVDWCNQASRAVDSRLSYLTVLLDCTYSKGSDWKKPTCVASKKSILRGVSAVSFRRSHLLTSRSFQRFGVNYPIWTLFDFRQPGEATTSRWCLVCIQTDTSPVVPLTDLRWRPEEILDPGWSRNQWLRTIGSTMHGPSSPFGNAGKCLGG